MRTLNNGTKKLESWRSSFFKIGLITAMAMLVAAFEWTSPLDESDYDIGWKTIDDVTQEFDPSVLKIKRETPPPPSPVKVDIEELIIVDDEILTENWNPADFDYNPEDADYRYLIPVEEDDEVDDGTDVFYTVEDMPKFNGGGINNFWKYIMSNISYPEAAAEYGIHGTVYVNFVINEKGEVCMLNIARGVDDLLDKEALRVVKGSPLWTPGKQRGKPVKVGFNLPVKFVLQ